VAEMTRQPARTALRVVLWVLFGLFFLFPLYAMADFSTRNLIQGGRTLAAWRNLVADEALYQAIVVSVLLAVFTVVAMLVLLVPTMIWVRLRAPWARHAIEFLCLLPLTIPALVIVVGLRDVYLWVTYFLGESALTLTFVYVVLVLPFAYRSLDARWRPSTYRPCRRLPARWAPAGPPRSAGSLCPTSGRESCPPPSFPSRWCSASTPSRR
jgi:ABC-type spermidine/putrescine transport system permease subunit II